MTRDGISLLKVYIAPILEDKSIIGMVLNFDEVESINSQGLGWLMLFNKELNDRPTQLALCNLSKRVIALFKMTQFDSVFKIYSTENEAIAMLKQR